MAWRIASLTTLLSILVLLRDFSGFLTAGSYGSVLNTVQNSQSDAESLLAQGRRLPLLCSTAEDLELLPGVTDRVAVELRASATGLARLAPTLGEQEALLTVRGIGPRRAPFFAGHLDLEQTCERWQGEDAPPPHLPENSRLPFFVLER